MKIPVLRTKITVPRRRPDLLTRERLINLLNDLLDSKLILVNAPPGYGKTSLLVDLAYRQEMPFCWYTLDALDQDLQRFLAHFIASIQLRFPEFGSQSIGAIHSAGQSDASLDYILTAIINEIYETISEHFAIVLDDFQTVEDSPVVISFINRFIQDVDNNCHVVILSRTLLPLPDLPLMVARSQVGGIGFQELAFRHYEIQALMLNNYQQDISEAKAKELAQRTEGWITGLLLSAQSVWQGMSDRMRLARVSGVGLYDYLIHQVLDQQPAELRDFLLKTSFLEEFNIELCARLLGEPPEGYTWGDMLESALHQNLFILPVGDDGAWLRYHNLFRDFLQSQMLRERPEQARSILTELVSIYSERSEWEKSYAICQRLDNPSITARLLSQAAGPLTLAGRINLLGQWLEALPAKVLEATPPLLARQGIVVATLGDTERGLRLLERAASRLGSPKDRLDLARAFSWQGLVHYIRADYQASLQDVEDALRLLDGLESDPEAARMVGEALRIQGQCYRMQGNLQLAVRDLTQALQRYQTLEDAHGANLVLVNLGAAYTDAGDLSLAMDCYKQTLSYYQAENNPFLLASVLNDLAFIYYLHGEYTQSFETFESALASARQGGNRRVEALILTGMGDLHLDLEAYQAASEAYQQARPIIDQIGDRFLQVYVSLAEAAIARQSGDLGKAGLRLELAKELVEQGGSAYFEGLHQLESGRLAVMGKNFTLAAEHFQAASKIFEAGGQRIEASRASLLLGVAVYQTAGSQAAEPHLGRAFSLASSLGNSHTLVPTASIVKPYLQAIAPDSNAKLAILTLLERLSNLESAKAPLNRRLRRQAALSAAGPPRLHIRAFGQAQVLLDRKVVTIADWHAQVTRDLFFLILSERRGWTKDEIGHILWPESTPSQLKLRFKNTIYRLRRALEQDVILFDGRRYKFNPNIDYEYDVEHFFELLEQAGKARAAKEQTRLYQAALQLYQGSYLNDISGAWVMAERERLRLAYLEAGIRLARLLHDDGQHQQSLEISRRMIAVDHCHEEAYLIAMQATAAIGNRAEVARLYESLERALQVEVGTVPSPGVESAYRSLMEHQ